eukprot:3113210-Rhodomonas_salina.1
MMLCNAAIYAARAPLMEAKLPSMEAMLLFLGAMLLFGGGNAAIFGGNAAIFGGDAAAVLLRLCSVRGAVVACGAVRRARREMLLEQYRNSVSAIPIPYALGHVPY